MGCAGIQAIARPVYTGREEVRGTTVQASGEIPPGVMPRTSEIETDSRWPVA